MALYRLRRDADQAVFDEEATDMHHALSLFGAKLKVNLAFAGPAAPDYMMGVIPTNQLVRGGGVLDIEVFKVPPSN